MNLILKLSSYLNKGEDPKSKTLLVLLALPIFTAIVLIGLIIYRPLFQEKNYIAQSNFLKKLDSEKWNTFYEDSEIKDAIIKDCFSSLECPGNMYSKLLFQNGTIRNEAHVERVSKLRGKRFWIGRIFSKEELKKWQNQNANSILVGYFYGDIEVFENGEKTINRGWSHTRLPLLVKIPQKIENDLYLSIRILHNMDEPYPDSLFLSGILTEENLQQHLRYNEYTQILSPAINLGFSLALGILFFMLWIASWKRQEFAAFSVVSLLQAPGQALLIPFVWLNLGNYWYHRFNFMLACYQGVGILFLGLAISRIRTWYSTILLVLLLILPIGFLFTNWNTDQFYLNSYKVYDYFQLSMYFVAAFLILIQAKLVSLKRAELWDPYREHKLYIFAFVLISIGFAQYFGKIAPWDMGVVYTQFVISTLAVVMAHEYRRQANFVSRSPLSKYHQMARELKEVEVILISIDLKNSESLFKMGALQGIGGTLVQKLMYHFSKIIIEKNAEIITSEGDSIIFFLPVEKNIRNVIHQSLNICIELKKALDEFLTLSNIPKNYELRIALELGVIRPIWHELSGRNLPGWEQVGNSNVFVDLARMLEAESLLMKRNESTVVIMPNVYKLISNNDLTFEHKSAVIKHNRSMELYIAKLNS